MFNTKTQLSDESKKILDNNTPDWTICEPPNNGIKIDNISKRVRVFKNDFAIEAVIFSNGNITIINTKQHYIYTDENTFKFIGSSPKTIKKIGELLIALSEIK